MELPDLVTTRRLRLRVITSSEARAALDGHRDPSWHPDYPRKDDLDAMSLVRGHSWSVREVIRGWDGLVCGTIGFYGPPEVLDDESLEAEVGYGLVEEARGHGLATEALAAMLAETDALDVRVRARVLPENAASIRVLAKCGFTDLRAPSEDGELVLARPVLPRS
jgi:RimJ/RimL family protein N-acetyltransferase